MDSQKSNSLGNEAYAYNMNPIVVSRPAADYRGDGPGALMNPVGSEVDVAATSDQRDRRGAEYDPRGTRHRRRDDYDYPIRPKKDYLGWNSLVDEGCKAWEAVLAEFLGVLVLVFIGCGSCVNWGKHGGSEPNIVQIAFAFGTARATIATVIGHISGTHVITFHNGLFYMFKIQSVNPAVTIGLCIGRKIKPAKALFYIVFQVLGAICGAVMLNFVVPESFQDGLGQTHPSPHVSQWQTITIEATITFMLTLTVFAVCDELRNDIKGAAPLMIGFVIMTCHLMAIPFTGSSMNPARSTGPAIVKNNFEHLWLYWFGPILGGIIAGVFYIFLLHKEEEEAVKEQTANVRATGPQPDPAGPYQWNSRDQPNGTDTTSNQSLP